MKISAVIPDDIAVLLKERARAEDRSLGAVIRRALADHIARPAATEDVTATPISTRSCDPSAFWHQPRNPPWTQGLRDIERPR